MENEFVQVKFDYLLHALQSLMDESRGISVKKKNDNFLENFNTKSPKKLALNDKVNEETTERVLNFNELSVEEICRDLNCSVSVAKKIKARNV